MLKSIPIVHNLKTWPIMFNATLNGIKNFEFRIDDREFKKGDWLLLQEYEPTKKEYSGRELLVKVTFILHGGVFGIPENYCIMSIRIKIKKICFG